MTFNDGAMVHMGMHTMLPVTPMAMLPTVSDKEGCMGGTATSDQMIALII